MLTKFWLEILRGRDRSEQLGTDATILLEWILKRHRVESCGLYSSGSEGPEAGSCDRGSEPYGSIT
jgi:hypothetical protein